MFAVGPHAIDPRALEAAVRRDGDGGIATFLGVVRDVSGDGRPVLGLEYEAHDEIAIAEFEAIAHEAIERFGDVRLAIAHRVGPLRIGEIAVAVCAASRHRAAAFDACEYAIDALKARAPIFKKELYADGDARWVENAC
jgi:molybdopterin synthase catalytic subunit